MIGHSITLSDVSNTVIGVLPKGYYFAPRGLAQFWTTLQASSPNDLRRSFRNFFGLARLKDGVSVQAASVDMNLMWRIVSVFLVSTYIKEGGSGNPSFVAVVQSADLWQGHVSSHGSGPGRCGTANPDGRRFPTRSGESRHDARPPPFLA